MKHTINNNFKYRRYDIFEIFKIYEKLCIQLITIVIMKHATFKTYVKCNTCSHF